LGGDPQERKLAAGALRGAAAGQAAADLLAALQAETDADLKAQIIYALGNAAIHVGNSKERAAIAAELIRQMEKEKDPVRLAAVQALGKLRHKSATEPLLKLFVAEHDVEALAAEIVNALGEIGEEKAADLVAVILRVHVKKRVRIEAALALGKIGGAKARAALKERLAQETDADVKAAIHKARTPVLRWTFKAAEPLP
jgi:HEAT repeat protein